MPDVNIPTVDLEKTAADLSNAIKEAAYVAVGLGVLGFQRAQVRRVELMKLVEAQLANVPDVSQLSGTASVLGAQAEAYVTAAQKQLAEFAAQVAKLSAEVLPNELADTAAVRAQLADLAKSVDEAVAPVRQQMEDQLDRVEEILPQAARSFVASVRSAAVQQEKAFRSAVGLA